MSEETNVLKSKDTESDSELTEERELASGLEVSDFDIEVEEMLEILEEKENNSLNNYK